MNSNYDIVRYHARFRPQVVEFYKHLLSPSDELNSAYFAWKLERNPYTPQPLAYLAVQEGTVVGMRTFSGMLWEAGEPRHTLTGLYADDLVIAPGHRNQGLIPRIMRTAFEDLQRQGYRYLFNLSAGPATRLSSLATGWRLVGSGRPMTRPAAPEDRAEPDALGRSPLSLADPALGQFLGANPGIFFAPTPPLDGMCALIERLGTDGRIRHVRDRTFLEWRFANPLSRYGFLFCGENTVEGFLVLQEYTSGRHPYRFNIVDWEAVSKPILARLLDAACRIAGERRQLHCWSATFSRHKLSLLENNGFRCDGDDNIRNQWNPVLVRALGVQPPSDWLLAGRSLTNLDDWDLRMLYSMHG